MKRLITHTLLLLVAALFTTAAQAHPAQELIETSTRDIMTLLGTEKERLENDPGYLKSVIDEKVLPHLDFNAMTALTIGKHWRTATPDQRGQLVEEFQQLLLNTYVSALSLYSGQQMEFKPFKPQKRADRAVVRAVFLQPGSKGVPVNYKLREKNDRWQIYDIDVNNINLVSTYRSTFTQRISQSGIDGLINEMRAKNVAAEEKKRNP
ncbi:MAG TPA: hypothetical protein DD979_13075 [Gammaproteobacteria bacterium]|nr:hypothetical protein [Gammaproteobacteria bacterium]